MHQHGLAGTGLRLVMEPAVRGGVGDPDGRALAEAERRGQRLHGSDVAGGKLGVASGAQGPHVIAALELTHAFADGFDDPGAVAAGDVGQRREQGVGARSDIGVDRIDTGGPDPHEHLAGAGLGIGDLVELQGLGAAELVNTDRLHALLRSGGRPGAAGMRGHRECPTYQTRSRGVVNRFVVVVIVCAARLPLTRTGRAYGRARRCQPAGDPRRPAAGAAPRGRVGVRLGPADRTLGGAGADRQGPRRLSTPGPGCAPDGDARRALAHRAGLRRSTIFATARAVSGGWPG